MTIDNTMLEVVKNLTNQLDKLSKDYNILEEKYNKAISPRNIIKHNCEVPNYYCNVPKLDDEEYKKIEAFIYHSHHFLADYNFSGDRDSDRHLDDHLFSMIRTALIIAFDEDTKMVGMTDVSVIACRIEGCMELDGLLKE
jgi:hypothetical protein